jgi:hypothetical protein
MGFASPRRRVDFAAQILVDESARAVCHAANGLGLAPLARERRSISDRRIDDAVTSDAFAASRSGSSAYFAVSTSSTRLLPDRRTAEGPSPTEHRRRIGPLPSP